MSFEERRHRVVTGVLIVKQPGITVAVTRDCVGARMKRGCRARRARQTFMFGVSGNRSQVQVPKFVPL